MEEEQPKDVKKRTAESLGWLTESSIMPRKQRAIEGVGASSILELKAQLYRSQEESKRNQKENIHAADHNYAHHLEVHRTKKIAAHDSFSAKNSGVDSRAAKDKLELKAVQDGSASYAALERKAELYDKLVRGELSDEEDQEKCCVDFFRKGLEHDESHMPQQTDAFAPQSQDIDGDYGDDDLFINSTKATGLGRASATVDRTQHKHFVMEVHEEANQEREKVSELKMRRQEQAVSRREKLKQAYLRKQLEKLKASKAEQT